MDERLSWVGKLSDCRERFGRAVSVPKVEVKLEAKLEAKLDAKLIDGHPSPKLRD